MKRSDSMDWIDLTRKITEENIPSHMIESKLVAKKFLNYLRKVLIFRRELLKRNGRSSIVTYQKEREEFKKIAGIDEEDVVALTRIIAKNTDELSKIDKLLVKIQSLEEEMEKKEVKIDF